MKKRMATGKAGDRLREIPLDNYFHFKSCVMCTFYPGVDKSLLFIYDMLGIKYENSPEQSSCTGFCYYNGTVPWESNVAINARNLSLAEKAGKDVVCVCPTSYSNLRECNDYLARNPENLSKTNGILANIGRKYGGKSRIFHASEVVHAHRQKLKRLARFDLKGLKVATHHGCHYTKIFYNDIAGGSCEAPTLLDEIAGAFGSGAADYTERTLCCGMGFHHTLLDREYSRSVALRKLKSIKESNADLILTQCPGCLLTLDYYQKTLEKISGEKLSIPVMNYAELVAIMLGADPQKTVGIGMHAVPADTLLENIGIKTGIKK